MTETRTIGSQLDASGLNLHAVFDLASLPQKIQKELSALYPDLSDYRQLILFAHGGKEMWENVQPRLTSSDHPIDDYSVTTISDFCRKQSSITTFKVIYPSQKPVGLQSLGKLAGWHHDSPFRVGINKHWGSWFAYRIAVLTDSDFDTSTQLGDSSPCDTCTSKPCIAACPAKALEGEFSLQRCINYRKEPNSSCSDRCLARMACPIGQEHQYDLEQVQYHYKISLNMIKELKL